MRLMRMLESRGGVFKELIHSKVAGLDDQQMKYVQSSWLKELLAARSHIRFNKSFFLMFRFLAVTGALVLPSLAGQTLSNTSAQSLRIATFVVSVVVAVTAGALQ